MQPGAGAGATATAAGGHACSRAHLRLERDGWHHRRHRPRGRTNRAHHRRREAAARPAVLARRHATAGRALGIADRATRRRRVDAAAGRSQRRRHWPRGPRLARRRAYHHERSGSRGVRSLTRWPHAVRLERRDGRDVGRRSTQREGRAARQDWRRARGRHHPAGWARCLRHVRRRQLGLRGGHGELCRAGAHSNGAASPLHRVHSRWGDDVRNRRDWQRRVGGGRRDAQGDRDDGPAGVSGCPDAATAHGPRAVAGWAVAVRVERPGEVGRPDRRGGAAAHAHDRGRGHAALGDWCEP